MPLHLAHLPCSHVQTKENTQMILILICFLVKFNDSLDCTDDDNNPDYIKCEEEVNFNYISCIVNCPANDLSCQAACHRYYNEHIEQCPCQKGK